MMEVIGGQTMVQSHINLLTIIKSNNKIDHEVVNASSQKQLSEII